MTPRVEYAVSLFKNGFNCSQAMLATFGPLFNLDHETALKVSGAFGGGMGGLGETCGAVTGAFMVIGLKDGRINAEDLETEKRGYDLVRVFIDRFKSQHGSLICREILGCDISTPGGLKTAEEKELFTTLCPQLVQDSAEIIEQLLD